MAAGKRGNKQFVTKAGSCQFRGNGTGPLITGSDGDISNNNCNFP